MFTVWNVFNKSLCLTLACIWVFSSYINLRNMQVKMKHCLCTSAGVWVLRLCRSPRQVMVEVPAALAVQPFRVVFANAATVDLTDQKDGALEADYKHRFSGG